MGADPCPEGMHFVEPTADPGRLPRPSGYPGHEFVGIVEESENPLFAGRRVVGEINVGCGAVRLQGRMERHCPDRRAPGNPRSSGMHGRILHPALRQSSSRARGISDERAVSRDRFSAPARSWNRYP